MGPSGSVRALYEHCTQRLGPAPSASAVELAHAAGDFQGEQHATPSRRRRASSPARPGRTVPAGSPRQDDRLGEVVVVRVAGCCRDLGDRPGTFPGPAVSTNLLHDSEELDRRDAGHETSGAAVHAIRSHGHCRAPQAGRRPLLKREGIGICTPIRTLREQTPQRLR